MEGVRGDLEQQQRNANAVRGTVCHSDPRRVVLAGILVYPHKIFGPLP